MGIKNGINSDKRTLGNGGGISHPHNEKIPRSEKKKEYKKKRPGKPCRK